MPSIHPDFEYDIFISYRQKDNKVDGWVTSFVEALKGELEATLKNPVSIYFDENPHDGLLETHQVNASLEKKLRCIVFMPIVSQTYCDAGGYAWQHEFLAFLEQARVDRLGLNVTLLNGNVASRVLPIQIHELDPVDRSTIETALGGPMRAIPFIYAAPGVNRPLRQHEDHPENNKLRTTYRDQINKVANALKEIGNAVIRESVGKEPSGTFDNTTKSVSRARSLWNRVTTVLVVLGVLGLVAWHYYRQYQEGGLQASKASVAVIPFRNNTGDPSMSHYGVGIASEVSTKLGLTKQFDFISSLQATIQYQQSDKSPAEIGKELGVTHILTGIYQAAADNIQVMVELMDAEGKVIWTLSYKTRYNDIFELQANIAGKVMDKFSVHNTSEANVYNPDLEAYAHYIKGVEIALKSNRPEDRMQAVSEYQQALSLDSGFIEPWWGIIEEYCYYYWNRGPQSNLTLEMIQSYMDYVNANFSDNWKKKAVMGTYEYWALSHYQKGLDLFLEALEEAPQDGGVHSMVAAIYRRQLKLSEAIKHLSVSLKQDPGAVIYWNELVALTQMNGDYESALKAAATIVDLNPSLVGNFYRLRRWTGTLKQLPGPVKGVPPGVQQADVLLEKRDLAGLLSLLDSAPDSVFSAPARLYYRIACHYLQGRDNQVRKLGPQYLRMEDRNSERRSTVLAMLGQEKEYTAMFVQAGINYEEDLSTRWNAETDQLVYQVLSGKYAEADDLLKEINRKYPQVGDYIWLNLPIFDRIKREYPAFQATIDHLVLPPRIMDARLIRM